MLRFATLTALMIAATSTLAQDVRYVSDQQFVPLRSGAGSQYRIVHRGIPSGTRLTVTQQSEDGDWAEITTDRGTSGWIRSQYLMTDTPAQVALDSAQQRVQTLADENATLQSQLDALNSEKVDLLNQSTSTESDLRSVSEELTQLKQISGKAVQLDADNRRLVETSETLRASVDMLESENQRLEDKLRNNAFMDGALAVLLGVIIALVVPRLWPKRKRNDGWA
ncbi:TIGR04211 family SH3 domain-containing protein [Parahalioglobus pacificus]|uniref:Signal transduction protein n=1 Tax=Parahalioglobus pacificus TaxID=930806 RepID=A0A918XCW2_9GAMM|nr:TIGR04211 family SH3 domain-containing protein [Halioglobus pacificus]GHD26419.1 signal transduction protein [Halioglobus pacificus]